VKPGALFAGAPDEAARLALLADLVARHALTLLVALVALLLAATWLGWRLLERHAPTLLGLAARGWRRIDRRRLVARHLGLHATLGFAACAIGVVAFFELIDELGAGEDLASFDVALAAALARHLGDGTLRLFSVLTHLGDPQLLWPLALAVTAVLAWRGERLLALARSTTMASPPPTASASRAGMPRARCWSTACSPTSSYGTARARGTCRSRRWRWPRSCSSAPAACCCRCTGSATCWPAGPMPRPGRRSASRRSRRYASPVPGGAPMTVATRAVAPPEALARPTPRRAPLTERLPDRRANSSISDRVSAMRLTIRPDRSRAARIACGRATHAP